MKRPLSRSFPIGDVPADGVGRAICQWRRAAFRVANTFQQIQFPWSEQILGQVARLAGRLALPQIHVPVYG